MMVVTSCERGGDLANRRQTLQNDSWLMFWGVFCFFYLNHVTLEFSRQSPVDGQLVYALWFSSLTLQ